MSKLTYTTSTGAKYIINDNDEIHRGGEGRIMSIANQPNIVAKLYHPGITPISEEKFKYLSGLDPNLFVVPIELLYGAKSKAIAGFIMNFLSNDFVPLSAFFGKSFCIANNIDDQIKFQVCRSLAMAVEYAHKHQVIIGDLNQYNILVNAQGDLRMIDTDSYETPNHKHSGLLLEEIRDFLHGGNVNQQSDYFALSVLIFYTLTFTHPFKGIHKIHKKISDRMMLKIPVFLKDPDLIPPKCYEPITSNTINTQYNKLYLLGERFLLDIDRLSRPISKKLPTIISDVVSEKDLIIHPILKGILAKNIFFLQNLGYIETEDNYFVYDTRNKGYITLLHQISRKEWSGIFISNKNVLLRKGESLFHYKNPSEIIELTNFTFHTDSIFSQVGDILMTIGGDKMSWVYLDDVMNQSVRNKRVEVFSRGFRRMNCLVQNAGGINRVFYHSGSEIATVKLDLNIKGVFITGNQGMVQYVEKEKIVNKFFKINGLELIMESQEQDLFSEFAYRATTKSDGIIFYPCDNRIRIISTVDYSVSAELECQWISNDSRIQICQSGIIVWTEGQVFLMNKK